MIGFTGRGALAALAFLLLSCASDPAADPTVTQLGSVVPAPGAVGVDPAGVIMIGFTHAMAGGVEQFMVLHDGGVTGPLVAGAWTWSPDRTRATFRPAAPLRSATSYTVHVGGGLMDAVGHRVGLERHGIPMGGQWVTGSMMGGGMMGATAAMMGPGWRHENGSYGMIFTFTTA